MSFNYINHIRHTKIINETSFSLIFKKVLNLMTVDTIFTFAQNA